MDLSFIEIYSSGVYKSCFKHALKNPGEPAGDKEQEAFQECFNRFYESNKIVANAFHKYIFSIPHKKEYPKSDD